jgi:hypothetical protein
MDDIKVTRTTDKNSAAYKLGRAFGAIITTALGLLILSGIVWGIAAIWQAITG